MLLLSLTLVSNAVHMPINWADFGLRRGIDLHFFTLRYYSLAYLVGIVAGYWHLTRMIKAPGAPMALRHADDLFFWCTMGIILGGRLGYALFYTGGNTHIPSLFTHFTPGQTVSWDLLRLWEGGMSFHGGLIGTVLAIAWVSRQHGLRFLRVCDYIAPCVPFAIFLVRIANFTNGELWGRVAGTGVRWAMVFPGAGMEARHPSQLYEAGLEGLVLMAIVVPLFWLTRARWRPGLLVGVFAAGYGFARFLIEYFREPDQQLEDFAHATGLSMGQWLTVPLIATGLFFAIRALRRPALGSVVPVPA